MTYGLREALREGLQHVGYNPSDRDLGVVLTNIRPEIDKIIADAVATVAAAKKPMVKSAPVKPEPPASTAPQPEPAVTPPADK